MKTKKNKRTAKHRINYFLVEDDATTYCNINKEKMDGKAIGFNGLSPTEWASLSKNVWNDLSSPRNAFQLEHGAVFPVKLAERIIKMYSAEGDSVFDPFAGIGTTLIATQNLRRHGIGIELNKRFCEIAEVWLKNNKGMFNDNFHFKIVNDDCRNMLNHIRKEKIQLTITSPPYANFIRKSVDDRKKTHKNSILRIENNSTVKPYSDDEKDFGNLEYPIFLEQLKEILTKNYAVTKKGGYSAWVIKDHRDTKNKIPYIAFHSDLAKIGQEAGFKFHDLIIWDQTGQRRLVLLGYPSVFYTNQNCSFIVIFRKI